MASDVPAGMVRSKPDRAPADAARIGERHVAKPDLARRQTAAEPRARGNSAPAGPSRPRDAARRPTGAAAPSSAQLNPPNAIIDVPTAPARRHQPAQVEARRRRPRCASDQNTKTFALETSSRLQITGLSRRRVACVLQLVQPGRRLTNRSIDPVGEAEQTQLFGGWRDRRRAGRRIGIAAAPRALRRCSGRARPRFRAAASASPATRRRARSAPTRRNASKHERAREAAHHLDQAAGDEVHRDGHAVGRSCRDRNRARR